MAISKMEKQEKTCGRKISGRMFFREYPATFFHPGTGQIPMKKQGNAKTVFLFPEKSLALFQFFATNFYSIFQNTFKWKSRKTMAANFYRL
jgi:hypothetical protein